MNLEHKKRKLVSLEAELRKIKQELDCAKREQSEIKNKLRKNENDLAEFRSHKLQSESELQATKSLLATLRNNAALNINDSRSRIGAFLDTGAEMAALKWAENHTEYYIKMHTREINKFLDLVERGRRELHKNQSNERSKEDEIKSLQPQIQSLKSDIAKEEQSTSLSGASASSSNQSMWR